MTQQPDPTPDPTLAVAERQLALLGELAEIAMAAARAFGASAVSAAGAEARILAEEYFTPEVGRARACGARDAAESFQKASRAVRLTLKLEMAVAEIVRDIRAGVVTHSGWAGGDAAQESAGGTPADPALLLAGGNVAGSGARDRDTDWGRSENDVEHLVEFDRDDTLPRAPLREAVERLCADVGVTVDWKGWRLCAPDAAPEALPPPPPERSGARLPGVDLSP